MTEDNKVKFVAEIEAVGESLAIRRPFTIQQENRRRFVRLEISTPLDLRRLKDVNGGYWPKGEERLITGSILNISGGGVLADLNEAIMEGDIVLLRFELQGQEVLDNVLGLVRRIEPSDGSVLTGIEFLTRQALQDLLSTPELELLSETCADFATRVRQVLSKFVYSTYPKMPGEEA